MDLSYLNLESEDGYLNLEAENELLKAEIRELKKELNKERKQDV